MLLHLDQIDTNIISNNSNVGGNIYLQLGQDYFPEENWYDIASLLLEQWIPEILSLFQRSTDVCKLYFYDGPCYALLRRNEDGVITVRCVYNRKIVIEETVIDFPSFMKSVVKAGNRFCRFMHQQGRACDSIADAVQTLKNNIRTVQEAGLYKGF